MAASFVQVCAGQSPSFHYDFPTHTLVGWLCTFISGGAPLALNAIESSLCVGPADSRSMHRYTVIQAYEQKLPLMDFVWVRFCPGWDGHCLNMDFVLSPPAPPGTHFIITLLYDTGPLYGGLIEYIQDVRGGKAAIDANGYEAEGLVTCHFKRGP